MKNKKKISDLIDNYNDIKKYKDVRSELWRLGYEEVGKGSSRTVFRISDNEVVKIAHLDVGIIQNNNEWDWFLSLSNKNPLAEPFMNIHNGHAIISEYVSEFTFDKFADIYKIHFADFGYHVGGSKEYIKRLELPEKTKKLIRDTTAIMNKFNIPNTEICRITAWGFTGNNAKLLDYGANWDMLQDYYGNKSK